MDDISVPIMTGDQPVSFEYGMRLERTPMLIRCLNCDLAAPTKIRVELGTSIIVLYLFMQLFIDAFMLTFLDEILEPMAKKDSVLIYLYPVIQYCFSTIVMLLGLTVRYVFIKKNAEGVRVDDFVPRNFKDVRHVCRSCSFDMGVCRPCLSGQRLVVTLYGLLCIFQIIASADQLSNYPRSRELQSYNARIGPWEGTPPTLGIRAMLEDCNFTLVGATNYTLRVVSSSVCQDDEDDVRGARCMSFRGDVNANRNENASLVVNCTTAGPSNQVLFTRTIGNTTAPSITWEIYMNSSKTTSNGFTSIAERNLYLVQETDITVRRADFPTDTTSPVHVTVTLYHSNTPCATLPTPKRDGSCFGEKQDIHDYHMTLLIVFGSVELILLIVITVRGNCNTRTMYRCVNPLRKIVGKTPLIIPGEDRVGGDRSAASPSNYSQEEMRLYQQSKENNRSSTESAMLAREFSDLSVAVRAPPQPPARKLELTFGQKDFDAESQKDAGSSGSGGGGGAVKPPVGMNPLHGFKL
eukprot:PhF_6_TR34165/c0_g1_i1/m.49976